MRSLLFALMLGCRASAPDDSPSTCTGDACAATGVQKEHCLPGFVYNDEGCEPVLPASDCAPGTMPIIGKTECQPVGVSKCADGFKSDGAGACNAILPAAKCAIGQMAIPGETTCAPVSPCAPGTWGDIPVDASTVYVDGSFAGTSDGTRDKPFKTIQAGIDKATGIVAVAGGTYVESLLISKPVRVIGVCPERVDLRAGDATAIAVEAGANGGSVSGLAVFSLGTGVKVTATSFKLEKLRIHGTGENGLIVVGPKTVTVTATRLLIEGAVGVGIGLGTAQLVLSDSVIRDTQALPDKTAGRGIQAQGKSVLTLKRSLLERNRESAIFVNGSEATIEGTVVRDTLPILADGMFGRGISARGDLVGKTPSKLTLVGSLIEKNRSAGVWVSGSTATITDTVIRDTFAASSNTEGSGIDIAPDSGTKARSNVTVATSFIAKNHDAGIVAFGSDLKVTSAIVRDNLARPSDNRLGTGIHAQADRDIRAKTVMSIESSLIAGNQYDGVSVIGADATIKNTVIADTQPVALTDGIGRGMSVQDDDKTGERSILQLHNSIIERNTESGVGIFGSDATVEGCVIRDTQPATDGRFGLGIAADVNEGTKSRSSVTIRGSLITRNHEGGILLFGSEMTVEGTTVRDTFAQKGDGLFGDGIAAMFARGFPASLTITSCSVRGSARAGVATFGGSVTMASSKLACGAVDLDVEASDEGPPTVSDGGKNLCGCGRTFQACRGSSTNLAPAQPPVSY